MSDYRTRVIEENVQLKERIAKLSDFILSPEFTVLSPHHQGLLRVQHHHMTAYQDILKQRIQDIDGANKPVKGDKVITTLGFWELMCTTQFVRLSYHRGKVADDYYYVEQPPEDVPGFIEGKIDETVELVKPRPFWKRFKAWWVA